MEKDMVEMLQLIHKEYGVRIPGVNIYSEENHTGDVINVYYDGRKIDDKESK